MSSSLEELGFLRSATDSSLFVRHVSNETLVVLFYVNDLIIVGNNNHVISQLKSTLQSLFPIKDLDHLNYFLGIKMAVSSKGLFLNQRKYIIHLLKDVDMMICKSTLTSLDSKLNFDTASTHLHDFSDYQRLVGKLIYLTITRPDITYAVSLVSQFMHFPTSFHLGNIKCILRYLKGSIGRGIVLAKNGHTRITGYSDFDWAGNALDQKLTTGYCMFVGGNVVSWRSKTQQVVTRSSVEVEYRVMASVACEMIWLKGILVDLGFPTSLPMTRFCYNQVVMHITMNLVLHE